MRRIQRTAGFTLIELVVVIVLLGTLSIGTVQFINDSSVGFANTVERSELASEAQATIARLTSELRGALPGSIRVAGGGSCVEFIPAITASIHIDLPVSSAATSFRVAAIDPAPSSAGLRTAVFPTGNPYALSANSSVSSLATLGTADGNNEIAVTLASAHQFPSQSPTRRVFFVGSPVSFCTDGRDLWRYQNYGYSTTQPTPASLPASVPDRGLLAEDIRNADTQFDVNDAALNRNAIVTLHLALERNDTQLVIEQLIQVRNAP